MGRREIIFSFVIFAVLCVFLFDAAAESKDKIDQNAINEAHDEGKANVILHADADKIEFNDVTVKKEIAEDTFSAELTESEIKKLAKQNYIQKIEYDYPVSAFLQDSAVIINATNTWSKQLSAYNLTGINQTICIIDTGANYSHRDLGGCYGNNDPLSACKVLGGYDFVNGDSN